MWLTEASRSADRLFESLATARATGRFLALAPAAFHSDMESRFPFATAGTQDLVQTLVQLAAYSGATSEQIERMDEVVRQLGALSGGLKIAPRESEYCRAA
ncbi:hypothetical protein FRUB_08873 [Fimbriiglobus ruber]|uniref:Uncharacterized protein n=2 Tax=Fimbriiglobus ruber TaxID=1908690 RepID=A0A225D3Z3_9BACT|nr:hypothetical protein FRUB_08873 [Fimbriiglobus ruber]